MIFDTFGPYNTSSLVSCLPKHININFTTFYCVVSRERQLMPLSLQCV